jgi:hypothetical protein
MDNTFQVTYRRTTITVPIDVRASWLCKRFLLEEACVLGVKTSTGVEIDLLVDNNTISRTLLVGQSTTLLIQDIPKPLDAKQREAQLVQRFLETGFWPGSKLVHLILNRFGLPLEVRQIVVNLAAPELSEEIVSLNNNNIGYQSQTPTAPASFKLDMPARIRDLVTCHFWLREPASSLSPPATIGLRHLESDTMFGPWPVWTADHGMLAAYGSSPDYAWHVGIHSTEEEDPRPKDFPEDALQVLLPAGNYHVIDSHIPSWSQNSESGNAGFYAFDGTKYSAKNLVEWGDEDYF